MAARLNRVYGWMTRMQRHPDQQLENALNP